MLASCSQSSTRLDDDRTAVESVRQIVDSSDMSLLPDIDAAARVAVAKHGATIVAIKGRHAQRLGDTFGTLTFSVTEIHKDPPMWFAPTDTDAPHCSSVDLNYYGRFGNGATAHPVRSVPCPSPLRTVAPPPDTTPRTIPATNASAAAISVLKALPKSPPASAEIAQRIRTQLEDPPDQYVTAAPPLVLVRGADIGVSMGSGTACVLVSRIAGVTRFVHVSPAQLQPGESPCSPLTALDPPAPAH